MPSFIRIKDDSKKPLTYVNINYVNNEFVDSLILGYDSVIGLLSPHYFNIDNFDRIYQPLLSCQKTIRDIVVSNDQRLISVQIDNVRVHLYFKTSG